MTTALTSSNPHGTITVSQPINEDRRQRNIDGDGQFGHASVLWRRLVDGLLGGVLHLVDLLGVLALRLGVDDVAGLLDRGVDRTLVLRRQVFELVKESHGA